MSLCELPLGCAKPSRRRECVVVMSSKNVDWDLLVRAGKAPLHLLRERVLVAGGEALDDAAERFVAGVADLDLRDLVVWLSLRRSHDELLPPDVPASSALVERFAARWSPADGFPLRFDGDGRWTLWEVAIDEVDPDAWDDLVCRVHARFLDARSSAQDVDVWLAALRTLHGGTVYRGICALDPTRDATFGAWVTPRTLRRALLHTMLELVACYRDDRACTRTLLARAVRGAVRGDMVPLWLLAELKLLDRVEAPTAVLPGRLDFGDDRTTEPDDARGERVWWELPAVIAVAWPQVGRVEAYRWLRARLLDAVATRRAALSAVDEMLYGSSQPGESPAGGVVASLQRWLSERSVFDDFMREAIARGVEVSTTWVTVVRDLVARRAGAWELALRWLDQTLSHAESARAEELQNAAMPVGGATTRGPLSLFLVERPATDAQRWTDVVHLGVHDTLTAFRWVVLYAPLPEARDALVEARVASLIDDLSAARDVVIFDRFLNTRAQLLSDRVAVPARLAALPPTPERRARVLSALRTAPWMLADDRAPAMIACVAPARQDELPPLDRVLRAFWTAGPTDVLRRALNGYVALGGAGAVTILLNYLRDGARQMLWNTVVSVPYLGVCAPYLDDALRAQIRDELASWPCQFLVAEGTVVAEAAGITLDLVAIAWGRLHDLLADFTALPERREFVDVTLARIAWRATEGEKALLQMSASATRGGVSTLCDEDRQEFVDREAWPLLTRAARMGVEGDRLRPTAVARVLHGHSTYASRYLDLLQQLGVTRRDLVELACTRAVSADGERDRALFWKLFPEAVSLTAWLGARMNTRSAWDADGAVLVGRLLDAHSGALLDVCAASCSVAPEPDRPATSRLDAMLVAFAEVFVARARDALRDGDGQRARHALLALMELDAPSRAYRFLSPLRRLVTDHSELEVTLEACEHLLRRDDDRVPSLDNIHRAVRAWDAQKP